MKELAQSWYGKGGSTTYGSNLVEVGVESKGLIVYKLSST